MKTHIDEPRLSIPWDKLVGQKALLKLKQIGAIWIRQIYSARPDGTIEAKKQFE